MNFLIAPFRWLLDLLRGISEVFELFAGSLTGRARRDASEDHAKRSLWKTVFLFPILLPIWIVQTFLLLVAYPFTTAGLGPEKKQSTLAAIPSLLMITLLLVAAVYRLAASKTIEDRYEAQLSAAVSSASGQDIAKALGTKLVSTNLHATQEQKFLYAQSLQSTGEYEHYNQLIEELAPDDKPGFEKAHAQRALEIALGIDREVETKKSKRVLDRLRWHLAHAGDEQELRLQELWAEYYLIVNQPVEAAKHLEIVAKSNPLFYPRLADIYSKTGNSLGESRALRNAESFLQRRLRDDPLLRIERIMLAVVLMKQGNLASAQSTILTGVQLHQDAEMRRQASSFFLLRFDQISANDPTNVREMMNCIEQALSLDLQNVEVYNRIIGFYDRSKNSAEAKVLRQRLEQMIAEGQNAGLAHFALSSILLLDSDVDNAEFHLTQAHRMVPNLPAVTNNLAWLLAHSKEPDLDRAMDLANQAVKFDPKVPAFRDTVATILMKQGKLEESIAEYERILPGLQDQRAAHRKLADMYHSLGQDTIAKLHTEKAK